MTNFGRVDGFEISRVGEEKQASGAECGRRLVLS